jgi:hypothetical protein
MAVVVELVIAPFTSALFYEGSSNRRSEEMKGQLTAPTVAPNIAPIVHEQRVVGGSFGLGGTF